MKVTIPVIILCYMLVQINFFRDVITITDKPLTCILFFLNRYVYYHKMKLIFLIKNYYYKWRIQNG